MCLAIPGRVVSIFGTGLERQGLVRFGDIERPVNLSFCTDAQIDDYVIVHVGCAIRTLDQYEAQRVLSLLSEITELGEDHALS
ncbi:HypC/HybG/HupF family hydrogenase formation chaperone [Congregibacter variabilis]|uniref:HypC/HybG/HupF family hydrogenase formation chaperone n=1 Tax=Congregibacter variabilis TaxID=3081200 RepID=A0ABZ0I4X0_9GAMM|nr:HypC/HybG/HupF family hydrogenase formation chaperone [Congregibacter sp. IMCC43200]